jgi:hypothetical protein
MARDLFDDAVYRALQKENWGSVEGGSSAIFQIPSVRAYTGFGVG